MNPVVKQKKLKKCNIPNFIHLNKCTKCDQMSEKSYNTLNKKYRLIDICFIINNFRDLKKS